MRFSGKTVVITGGSSGIGLAAARMFSAEGALVVLAGRSLESLRAAGVPGAVLVAADVSRVEDIERLMAAVPGGAIDVLFANAGMSECPPIAETDAAFFDRLMGINVKGVFFSFTKALPLMRSGACAIFTATATHDRGKPGDPLYLASKAAVRSLARSLAGDPDVLARKIRVNVVSPGPVETPLTVAAHADAGIRSYVEGMIPLGRWGQPDDIARAVLFLASSDASFITGADLAVDGGLAQI